MPSRVSPRRIPALLLAILLALAGCGSSESKQERAGRTVRSWGATARLTARALAGGSVPVVYGRQVLRITRESQQQESKQPEWVALPSDLRDSLDRAVHQLERALERRSSGPPLP